MGFIAELRDAVSWAQALWNKYGLKALPIFVLAAVVAVIYFWTPISHIPAVQWAWQRYSWIPHGDTHRLSIGVLRVAGPDETHDAQAEDDIIQALNDANGIDVVRINRAVNVDDPIEAKEEALKIAREGHLDIITWGVLLELGKVVTPKLFWVRNTPSHQELLTTRLSFGDDLSLPSIDWSKISPLIELVISDQAAQAVAATCPTSIASGLPSVLERARPIADDPELSAQERSKVSVIVANALETLGETRADEQQLRDALAWYRRGTSNPRDRVQWATVQSGLGSTTLTQAIDRNDIQEVEQAIRYYDAALKVFLPRTFVTQWEILASNRAAAFNEIGKVRYKLDADVRAIKAYKAILRQVDSKGDPSLKASVENNLGAAMTNVGQLGSLPYLKGAITDFEDVLSEPASQRDRVFSALVQTNEGVALHELGLRTKDPKLLHRAAAEYSSALSLLDQDCQPSKWVYAQYNLANTFLVLGQQEHSTDELQDSIGASRAALSLSEGNTALSSAAAQAKIAEAEFILGYWSSDARSLELSIAEFRKALPVLQTGDIRDWSIAENNLGNSLADLADLAPGSRDLYLREAVDSYQAALRNDLRTEDPTTWAQIQEQAGLILHTIGREEGDGASLTAAISAYKQAALVWSKKNSVNYALDEMGIAETLDDLYGINSKAAELGESVAGFRVALSALRQNDQPFIWGAAQQDLGGVLYALGMNERSADKLLQAAAAFDAASDAFNESQLPDDSEQARSAAQKAYEALANLAR